MKKPIIALVVTIALTIGLTAISLAQNATKTTETKPQAKTKFKKTTQMKEVQGEVTWLTKNHIALVYATDEGGLSDREILLPFGKEVKLQHVQELSQIKKGDMVLVQYEEVIEEGPEGKQENRVAKLISFVRPAVQKPSYGGEDGVMRSN